MRQENVSTPVAADWPWCSIALVVIAIITILIVRGPMQSADAYSTDASEPAPSAMLAHD
jgi:hypothetical protein